MCDYTENPALWAKDKENWLDAEDSEELALEAKEHCDDALLMDKLGK